MSDRYHDSTGWTPCPRGEFRRLEQGLATRARRRQLMQLAAAGVLGVGGVALAVGAGSLLPRENRSSGFSCADVQMFAKDYSAGSLDGEKRYQVKAHLARCPLCAKSVGDQIDAIEVQQAALGRCDDDECGSACGSGEAECGDSE